MKKLKTAFSWCHIFHKRLFLRPSFLILLALVPITGLLLGIVAGMDSGVLTVYLASEEENENVSNVMLTLMQSDDVLRFVESTPEEAEVAVKKGKADAAWIFKAGFDELSDKFADKQVSRNSLVTVIQREDDVTLMLAREKLCGALYPYVSYSMYLKYVKDEVSDEIDDETLKTYYDAVMPEGEDLFEISYADGGDASENSTGYLTAPLRGLLSVMVVLAGLAVSMFYKLDGEKGLFVRIPKKYQLIFSLGYHFAPIFDVGIALFLSLMVAGVAVDIIREALVMIIFVAACSLFCMTVERICSKLGALCAVTPLLVIGMIVICPVFFNIGFLRPLQILFPPYFYLNGVYNNTFVIQMLIYIAALAVLNILLFAISRERLNFD